jgi:hypothetical protein
VRGMEKGRSGKWDNVGGSGTERYAISARTSPLVSPDLVCVGLWEEERKKDNVGGSGVERQAISARTSPKRLD